MPSLKPCLRTTVAFTASICAAATLVGPPAIGRPPLTTSSESSLASPQATVDLSTATASRGTISSDAKAEIRRVLTASTQGISARSSVQDLAEAGVKCASFEGQRYCLGLGWTSDTEQQAQARIAGAARSTSTLGRAKAVEQTGDRDAAAMLRERANLTPTQRERADRRELKAAARSVAKVWLLRHQIQGTPLPAGFLAAHPEIDTQGTISARGGDPATPTKTAVDYPSKADILHEDRVNDQRRSYWCGPATMQMIAWTKFQPPLRQAYWAKRMRTTSSGSNISDLVRVVNNKTNWDKPDRAGAYVVLDIKGFTFPQWVNLMRRHVVEHWIGQDEPATRGADRIDHDASRLPH